jgi:outer membrane protein assembly factor BamB
MRNRVLLSALVVFALLVMNLPSAAQSGKNWAQFRGPQGAGIAAEGPALPVEFNSEKNLIWKTEIGKGNSSPCIWGDKVFLTAFEGKTLQTLCLDLKTGKTLWEQSVTAEKLERVHPINTPATPTAVADGERVYVYFGSYGLISYDFSGKKVWERRLPPPPVNMYGTASSPILAGGKLIFFVDMRKGSWIEAADPKTGETIWKTEREGFTGSWSSPLHWQNNGVDEIVIYGIWWMKGYDLKDGSERWSLPGLTDEPCITPVIGDGLIYLTSYNMKNNPEVIGLPYFSDLLEEYDQNGDGELNFEEIKENKSVLSRYDADGEGDHPLRGFFRFLDVDRSGNITEKEWAKMISFLDSFEQENALLAVRPGSYGGSETKVEWRHSYGVPECPSPLFYDGLVYMVKNGGIISCLEAKTGGLKYQSKLGAGGPYYSSPVVGDGKIYVASARGVIAVFKVGEELEVLARNNLGERIMATPAIVNGKIYVRTEKSLFAFGLKN